MRELDITTLVVREYFSALDCPTSLSCWMLFNYGEHQQLVDKVFNPLDYNSPMEARNALAALSYLSKSDFLTLRGDKKEAAIDKFFEAERRCLETNSRLAFGKSERPEIFSIRRKIAKLLGSFDPEEFIDSCSWGPGATLNIRGDRATGTTKFDNNLELTPACYNFCRKWFSHAYPNWDLRPEFHLANKVITVPKNAKTDRVIAIEPSGNLWFQKGVGSMIKRRLRASGIDLSDQGHNQRLSRVGSRYSNLATIDFSAASDTISINTVLSLIPGDWLDVLCLLRSPHGNIAGSCIEYEKFSSMGNGFTFELESLIFYCIALSCTVEEDYPLVSIYGDDLIVPSYAVPQCLELFSYFGFVINESKSFWTSYYRESCGKHYWNGLDITPLYLKERIIDRVTYIKANNAIRRYSHRLYGYGCDVRFRSVCSFIRNSYGKNFNRVPPLISDGFGDGGFICNFDEAAPPKARHGHQGFIVKLFVEKPRELWSDSHGLLLNRLWCTMSSDRAYGNIDFLPRRTKLKFVRTTISVWSDLGPWL